MPSLSQGSRVLVTGGGGFLGRHLVEILRRSYTVTSFDIRPPEGDPLAVAGSVTDPAAVTHALEGQAGLVIGHMASRGPGVYDSPELPFDINVKATAQLFQAALREGVRRVVLISSSSVVGLDQRKGNFLTAELAPSPIDLYALSKTLQEQTAHFYHQNHGLEVAMLRPAYVCLGDSLEDKYGIRRPSVNWQFIDPRDIGGAAAACLSLPDLSCETFHLMAGPGAEKKADIERTFQRLGWEPQYRFREFPQD